jgi:MFS transporter, putative metabolite:H+ symporter
LFSGDYRKRTIVIIMLWFLTSFANFGLTTWAPSIYTTVYHVPIASALRYAATASTLFLVATPVIAMLLDPVGRRPFAIFGTGVACVALFVLSFYTVPYIWQVVALVVTAQLCSSIGAFILWPYTAESYPTQVRAVGLGVCSSTARAASMLTPLFVGVILSRAGSISVVFGVFSLFALAAMLLWLTATKETARVRLETL